VKKLIVLICLITVPALAKEPRSADVCIRMAQVRDDIEPRRNYAPQAAVVAEGFKLLENTAKQLKEDASPACLDAFTTLAHRLIKASPAFEGIESFGIFWGKNEKTKKAAQDAINRLPELQREEMQERLDAFGADRGATRGKTAPTQTRYATASTVPKLASQK